MTVLDIGARNCSERILPFFHFAEESFLNKLTSPGGWSQVIVEELKLESPPNVAASEHGRNENERFSRNDLLDEIYSMPLINFNEKENKNESGGSCVSCDLRPFRHVNGARQVIGDIFEKETLDQIQNEQREFDLVVSGNKNIFYYVYSLSGDFWVAMLYLNEDKVDGLANCYSFAIMGPIKWGTCL